MTDKKELPFIDKKEILSAEFRRLSSLCNEKKSEQKPPSKSNKSDVFNKTNGICHICGDKLNIEKFSITNSAETELPACQSCKRIFDNYLPEEIKWILKIGLWAKTQIEYETEIGKEIAIEFIEQEKYREQRRMESRNPLSLDLSEFPLKNNPFVGKLVKKEYKLLKEKLYWSYANLSMAHKAINDKVERYSRIHYAIRAKLFKGLMEGTMNPRSLFHDEKNKLESDKCCVYCGKTKNLQLDHIIPKNKGGKDAGENLVWACRSCNASKNDTDLMEWYNKKGEFPPLQILRNYMKLIIQHCVNNEILETDIDEITDLELPFSVEFIPTEFPQPSEIIYRNEMINKNL